MTRPIRRIAPLALLLAGACVRQPIPGPEPIPAGPADPRGIESMIFLVGDAGQARSGNYPILTRLRQDIEWWSEHLDRDSAVTVLFLGDIVYPLGLRDPGTREYPADSAVAMDQVLLLAGAQARARGAQGYFLAGNHDWGLEEEWEGALRLAALSDFLVMASEHTGASVAMEPAAGTGGPTVLDLGTHVRLLLLDSAWWLLHAEAQDGLAHMGVLKWIEEAMLTAGDREIIIAAHHPFRSAGPHGGEFSFWRTFGVRYVLARSGAILQDVTSLPYRALERGLRDIFSRVGPPIAFVGGHEHSLQVIHGTQELDPPYNIVSGSASKMSSLGTADGMQFGRAAPGYMRLAIGKDGSMDLFVESAPEEFQSCPAEGEERDACMREGVAAFETVHAQRLR
jgi:hypothetical protein